jgi:hypothetical protein
MPELEVDLVGKLIALTFPLQELCLLLVEECARHKDLICKWQNVLLVSLRNDTVLLSHVKNEEATIL